MSDNLELLRADTKQSRLFRLIVVLASLPAIFIIICAGCNKTETVSSNGPRLRLSPSSLTFHGTVGAGPTQQQVAVTNAGTDGFHFTASKNRFWLTVIPTTDTAPAQILVQPVIGSLGLGTYHDTITVTATGATGSPQQIPVTFIVGDSLTTSFAQLTSPWLQFEHPLTRTLTIAATSASALPVTLSKQSPWLGLSVNTGNTPLTITLTLSPTGLALGRHLDTITIASNGVGHPPLKLPIAFDLVPWLGVGVNSAYDFSDVAAITSDSFIASAYTLGAFENEGWTYISDDQSRSWRSTFSRDPALFSDIEFVNHQFGWMVGDSALFLFTTNGGADWFHVPGNILPIDSSIDMRGISFASETIGWAVGAKGKILGTTDGGATWHLQNSTTNLFLTDVVHRSATSAWVIGNAGMILHSADGVSWAQQTSGTSIDLWGICALTDDSLIVVGNSGSCLVTTNGGANWTARSTGTGSSLLGVAAGRGSVWLVGRDGTILRSGNFGQSFATESSGTIATLTAVLIHKTGVGVIVGEDGTILRTRFVAP